VLGRRVAPDRPRREPRAEDHQLVAQQRDARMVAREPAWRRLEHLAPYLEPTRLRRRHEAGELRAGSLVGHRRAVALELIRH